MKPQLVAQKLEPCSWEPFGHNAGNLVSTRKEISPPRTNFSSKPRWTSSVSRNSTITARMRRRNHNNRLSKFQESKIESRFQDLVRRLENSRGFIPDADFSKGLILELSKIGKTKKAARVLEIFEQSGAVPNVVMYTVMIRGYCMENNVDKALQLLDRMKVPPNVVTYNTLLKGLCDSGKLDRALQLLDMMKVSPDVVTYNTLLNGLCGSGKLDMALQLLDGMKVSPDVVTYNTILKGLCDSGKHDRALDLLERMKVSPDVV